MCGITGWVDFTKDLRTEREIVQAMTDSMSLRGPDEEGLWLSPHAAIGHRRLAVIDLPGGRQPMTEGDVVLTYSGEIYNYRELRSKLIAAGHTFRTQSDTEVVLRAYLEWGIEMVHQLNGMYAFAIWDGKAEELLLVRDRLGVKPLYYYPLADGLLFGSEPKAILANPLAERVVNPTGFCGFLILFNNTDGQTIFRNLFDLQPGHYVRFSRAGMSKHRYWALEARPHEDDLPTTIATVRELLEDIVARQLISDVPLCMLLSGGLDSSALTALAYRAIGQTGEENTLRSFAVDFSGHAENFQPDIMRATADRPFVHEVAHHVGCTHQDILLDTEQLWDPKTRSSVLHAWDLPHHVGDMDISLYLLFKAIREQSTVAISGEAADEVFGGYPWAHDQAALQLPIFPWMAIALKSGTPAPFGLFSPELVERMKVIEYVTDMYSNALAEVPRLEGEEGEQARMREVTYFDLTRFLRGLLDRKDRTSMAVGLEVRVPFCDHRLVEYVFNVPWAMKHGDGHEKTLLRKATEDLLPESVLQRRKSAFPTTNDPRYDQRLQAELGLILDGSSDDAPVRRYMDIEAARTVADAPVDGASGSFARLQIEGVVRMNAWLSEYQVDMGAL
jgi:asparagine synthase (glutamine-hydrolysing)